MIISLLILLLYAVLAAIVLEVFFWAIGLFLAVPPKIRQLLYMLVGVVILIQAVQIILGGSGPVFPYLRH